MLIIHFAVGIIIIGLGLMLGIWALRERRAPALSRKFWQIQGILQIAILLQSVTGIILYLEGNRPKDPLHLMYGAIALLAIGFERGAMPGQGIRQTIESDYGRFNEGWVFGVANLLIFAVAGRALTTAIWGF